MIRGPDGQRGSITVEIAILAPIVGLLLASVVLVGRVQVARADLQGVARSVARELSIARDPTAAASHAQESATAMLDVGSPTCRTITVSPRVDASEVAVTITCVVDLAAASVLPVPASMSLSATAVEARDLYREAPR